MGGEGEALLEFSGQAARHVCVQPLPMRDVQISVAGVRMASWPDG